MMDRTFTVRLLAEDNFVGTGNLTSAAVEDTLRQAYMWTGVEVVSVERVMPALTGKITAIRDVRNALQCGLRDAKFLVDSAQEKGTARWANVVVTCDLDLEEGLNRFMVETGVS